MTLFLLSLILIFLSPVAAPASFRLLRTAASLRPAFPRPAILAERAGRPSWDGRWMVWRS